MSPAATSAASITASTSVAAASGCTCQKPDPETRKSAARTRLDDRPMSTSSRAVDRHDTVDGRLDVVGDRRVRDQERVAGRRHDRLDRLGVPLAAEHVGRSGCAIRQRSTGMISCERCLRSPGRPSSSTANCIRVRQPSASGSTASTSPSQVMPASRRSCSRTTSPSSARCVAGSTCWKSQPPHSPGPAYGHGASTRPGAASITSTASARRNDLDRSVMWIRTRSPGSVWRTNTTWPSSRATQWPPWAIGPDVDDRVVGHG